MRGNKKEIVCFQYLIADPVKIRICPAALLPCASAAAVAGGKGSFPQINGGSRNPLLCQIFLQYFAYVVGNPFPSAVFIILNTDAKRLFAVLPLFALKNMYCKFNPLYIIAQFPVYDGAVHGIDGEPALIGAFYYIRL